MVEAALMNSLPQDKKRYPDDPEMESLMRVFNTACSGEGTPTSPMLTSTKQVGKIDSVDLSNVDEGLKKKLLVTGISSPNTSFIKIDSLGLAPKTPELMVI